jgi:hypothetical protein
MKRVEMLNGCDARSHRGAERRDQRADQARRSNLFRYWGKTVAALLLCSALAAPMPVAAVSAPFAQFTGTWSGNGTIHVEGGAAERIRCTAAYQPRAANELAARLRCASDSYNFDLTGELTADAGNQIRGRWMESSRGIAGSVAGTARGDRMQLHVESSGFVVSLTMLMRGRRQDVSLDSHGAGQMMKASISMSRR